jgi:hypothetical protein
MWNLDINLTVGPPPVWHDDVNYAAFSADGKVHVVLQEAGLEDLLSEVPAVNSFMNVRHGDILSSIDPRHLLIVVD